MKKLALIALLALLAACEKVTFQEYYSCEKTYKARAAEIQMDYKEKRINLVTMTRQMEIATQEYEQCLKEAE